MIAALSRIVWTFANWTELVLITLIAWLAAFLPVFLRGAWNFRLFRIWCRTFVRALGVDLRLHQMNRTPLPARYILIANHPSCLEDVGIPSLFPVRSLAKQEVREWPFAGRISDAAGSIYVRRESRESRGEAAEMITKAVLQGYNVAIYPEGGCKGRRLHTSFRHGAFDVSLKTGVPIVPVFLHYESQEDFEWQLPWTLPQMLWRIMRSRNRRANYYVFDAIDPARFGTREEFNASVYRQYQVWQARYLGEP